jgi:hypothetical protein
VGEGEGSDGYFFGCREEAEEVGGVKRSPTTITVTLSSVGNPDRDQYFGRDVLSPTRVVQAKAIAEASRICRAYIKQFDLGAGNWSGGLVCLGRKPLARVSYNGRVWPVE